MEILNDYHVSLAHILISHNQSDVAALAGYWPWRQVWPPNERSHDQAFAVARELFEKLKADPAQFEAIARERSDDRITAPYGGNYGVMRCANLLPELLDAYEALSEGEVSKPFETAVGIHLVKRLPIPAERFTWSRRIMVMYAPVPDEMVREARNVTRTRDEARALADELSRRARAKPEEFAALIDKYSDEVFAEVGGDMGPQSNLDGRLDVARRLTTARLNAMEISEPLDELGGYAIIQRLPDRPLERRAFESIRIDFDRAQNPTTMNRTIEEARTLSTQLAASIAKNPRQFDAARAEYCQETTCDADATLVTDGSDYPTIYRGLAGLAIGEVSTRPERSPIGMVVYRRVAVRAAPEGAARLFRID